MPFKSWIIDGTYNPNVRKQIASIVVTVERRHAGGGAAKRKRFAPTIATIRDNGTWVAVVSGQAKKGANTLLFAVVSFFDVNGVELRRMESVQLPNV